MSSSNFHRIILLVSTHMFSWSKNRMKLLIQRLGHSYVANLEKSKMAASKKKLWQNHDVYIETKLYLLTFYKNNKWYSNVDKYGYKRYLCVSEFLFYAVIVQKYVLICYDGNLAGPLSCGTEDMHS